MGAEPAAGGQGGIADAEYVASTTLTETTWNATILEGDVVTAVADLKDQPGQDLLKFGTGSFSRTLMQTASSTNCTFGGSP